MAQEFPLLECRHLAEGIEQNGKTNHFYLRLSVLLGFVWLGDTFLSRTLPAFKPSTRCRADKGGRVTGFQEPRK